MTSPEVVFNYKFYLSLESLDRKKKGNKTKDKIIKRVLGMFDYYSNEEKRVVNMFDYYTGEINKSDSVNLIIEDGSYATNEEIKIRKEAYTEYIRKANLCQGVISFNNEYIEQNVSLKELEQKMIKDVIPRFFRACGFKDAEKMSYQLALHSDTDNYHFHFSFIEKEPNYIGTKNKIVFRRKGKLSKNEIDSLKNLTLFAIEKDKKFTPMLKSVNKEIDELKRYFRPDDRSFILKDKKDLILEENILRLGEMLYENRSQKKLYNQKIKYKSIFDKEIINLTNNIKKYLFKDQNSSLLNQKEVITSKLIEMDNYLNSLNERNNSGKKKTKNSIVAQKEEYIDNYIYNSIVNSAYYKYNRLLKRKKYLKVDDIIQEAVLREYKKNNKNSRLSILKDYLSNTNRNLRFKNRYKIEQAIKNINSEMEEAQEKFKELFKSNSYDNES